MTDYRAAPEFRDKADEFCRKHRITSAGTIVALGRLLETTAADAKRDAVSDVVTDLRLIAQRLESLL